MSEIERWSLRDVAETEDEKPLYDGLETDTAGNWVRYEICRDLQQQVEVLQNNHCQDCCCARAWNAIGILEHSGIQPSIPEIITAMKQQLAALHISQARSRH